MGCIVADHWLPFVADGNLQSLRSVQAGWEAVFVPDGELARFENSQNIKTSGGYRRP